MSGLIAIDIDNTLCHTSRHFIALAALNQGLQAPQSDPEAYELERHLAIFPDQARARRDLRRTHGGLDLEALHSCPPDEGARQCLIGLSGERFGGRPVLGGYLTRRGAHLRRATAQWLWDQGFPLLPVHSTQDAPSGLKSAVMAQYGYVALIDDAPHEAHEVSLHAPVALRQRAYNRGVTGRQILPFERWVDFPLSALLR